MKKIICFGDSNTWGHDPIDGSRLEMRWPFLLSENKDWEIIEAGVCGRSAKNFYPENPERDSFAAFVELCSSDSFDLLIITLGTNDYLNTVAQTPEQLSSLLGRYIDLAKECNVREILLISPVHISEAMLEHPVFSTLYSQTSIDYSKQTAEKLSVLAKEKNVHFFDLASIVTASDKDGIHLDPDSHRKIATTIGEIIGKIL